MAKDYPYIMEPSLNNTVPVSVNCNGGFWPSYSHDWDSGFDLAALNSVTIAPGETVLVKTGLIFDLPKGYEIQVRPRSGMSLKTGITVKNSPGTVDSTYRGDCGVILHNSLGTTAQVLANICIIILTLGLYKRLGIKLKGTYTVNIGDRVAQGVLARVVQASFGSTASVEETDRGINGFGSTGVCDARD